MDQMRKLQRALIVRFLFVSLLVSVLFGAFAAYSEYERVFQVATERILTRADVLRAILLNRLDRRELSDGDEVREALRVATSAQDRPGQDTGHYVFGRLLDGGGKEVERLSDDSYGQIADVVSFVDSETLRLPASAGEADFTTARIAGKSYVHALVPLPDSRGAVAAHVEGFFATTSEERRVALLRLIRVVALAVGTVLLTTALLYPIIRQLMRRLGTLSITLLDANLETLRVLGGAIAKRDSDTDAHNYRVTI